MRDDVWMGMEKFGCYFWDVTPCSVVDVHQRMGGGAASCSKTLEEAGCSETTQRRIPGILCQVLGICVSCGSVVVKALRY